eukprot:344949-Amphidinium_carterae.2
MGHSGASPGKPQRKAARRSRSAEHSFECPGASAHDHSTPQLFVSIILHGRVSLSKPKRPWIRANRKGQAKALLNSSVQLRALAAPCDVSPPDS